MVVGEIIIGASGDNTALTFQPALGVTVLITAVGLDDETAWFGLTDGVSNTRVGNKANVVPNDQGNLKVFINNTIYLSFIALGAGVISTYHGVQVE